MLTNLTTALRKVGLYPNLRSRHKDKFVHNASDSGKCSRQITYKALGYKPSNPADELGKAKMEFGNWIESGIKYSYMQRLAPFGVVLLGGQGQCGDYDLGGEAKWHGFRDFDLGFKREDGKYEHVVVELKTKVGFGADCFMKVTPFSKKWKVPFPDHAWGHPQQLALYLHNIYNHTKDNPEFTQPTTKGILLYYLYSQTFVTFVEFWAEYFPERREVIFSRAFCEDIPEACGDIDLVINIDEIADKFKHQDKYIAKGELAPPDYQRRYTLMDKRVREATKTDLQKAINNTKLIGDVQCAYCAYRDTCAKDLDIDLNYTQQEIKTLKSILKDK